VVAVAGLTGSADDKPVRPIIRKLGTIDLLMVETTPVVFKDRLSRFEYVRDNYPANKTGVSYFRFLDVATGEATPAFARGRHLGCAFVEGDTAFAYGVDRWGGPKITVFRSKDLNRFAPAPTPFGSGSSRWSRTSTRREGLPFHVGDRLAAVVGTGYDRG
jgi:hypothetical protein